MSTVAICLAVLLAAAFVLVHPGVGDLWAARARESAALHGVGWSYWFAWFGGTVPGQYSLVSPYLSRFVDPGLLGAGATVLVAVLCARLLRGSAHPTLGTWLAAVGFSASLWSGRVPFALGSAFMVAALLAIRHRRRWAATAAAAAAALTSPVSGVFLLLALTGVLVHQRHLRSSAVPAFATAVVCLISVAAYFGTPGPEGFGLLDVTLTMAAIALMLLARPPDYVRTVLVVSLVAAALIAAIPNGMGSNFERFAWICLPVAVAATARAPLRSTALLTGFAVACGGISLVKDLTVAAEPTSSSAYYSSLARTLDHTSGVANYRVEVVPNGTHVAAFALLGHALLARGYETQSDNALDSEVNSPALGAAGYKKWLDDLAVGFVAVDRSPFGANSGAEARLVRSGRLGYLHEIWSDPHWRLFRVSKARPIVAPPAQVVDADQAALTVAVPRPVTTAVRVRWSRFLRVRAVGDGRASVAADGSGWTRLTVTAGGRYILSG